MSGAQKLALSLLIAVVVFSGFAVFAWSGLFDFIETTFYLQRIEENVGGRVAHASESIARFHKTNIDRFQAVLAEDAVRRVFSVNQSQADNRDRDSYFVQLEAQLPGLAFVRFIDLQGSRLHFSTNGNDYTETGTARQYIPVPEISPREEIPLDYFAYESDFATTDQALASPDPDVLVAPSTNQFIYRLPSYDEFGILQGSALFYVHTSGLVSALVRDNIVGLGYDVDLIQPETAAPDGIAGIIVNMRPSWGGQIADQLVINWDAVASGDRPVLTVDLPQTLDGEPGATAFLPFIGYGSDPGAGTTLTIYLLPEDEVRMTDVMRIAVLSAIFLTSFLLVYLLLNLRQDAVVVLSDRVKRFQIHLLREYMESKEDMNFQRWRSELEDRREEVAKEIRRGIGRIRPAQQEEVDQLINNTWDEILEVLSGREAPASTRELDLDRLEDIVERVVGNFQNIPSAQVTKSPSLPVPVAEPAASPQNGQPIDVEEVDELDDVEELGDLEDAGDVEELGEPIEVETVDETEEPGALEDAGGFEELDGLEDAGDVEELGEPVEVETVDEMEELGDLEDAGDAVELGEPIEVETVDEMEELGDLEDAGDAVELGKPIEVETVDEMEELGDLEDAGDAVELGEPIEVETVDEMEELGDLEDAGDAVELGEPIEVETVDETEEPGALEDAEDIEEPADLEDAGDVEELGDLEDAEVVAPADGYDEAAELEWLAESETLNVEETTLEDLETEIQQLDATSDAGLEEAETVEDLIADEAVSESAEVDYWPDDGDAELVEEIEEAEPILSASDEIEVLEEAEDEGGAVLEGDLEQVKSGASPFMGGMFSFGPGISSRPLRRQERESDANVTEEIEEVVAVDALSDVGLTEQSEDVAALEEIGDVEEVAESAAEVAELEELESGDSDAAIEADLEEVEPLDESVATKSAPVRRAHSPIIAGSSIRFTELRELVTPEYEIATVISLLDRLHVDKNIIVDNDGLIEIDRGAYADSRRGHDDEMKGLVESVMGDPADDVQTGVEQIFARGDIDLLSPSDSDSDSPETPRKREEPGTSLFRFIDRGFDYDAFLRGYRPTEGGTIKSLVSFTRLWGAQVGILYEQEGDDLHPRFALGVEESCWQSMIISGSSGIFRNVLAKRHVLYLDQPLRHVEYFNGLCADEQISFFVKSVFLPVVINGNSGYAVLGFRDDVEDLTDLFRRIMPQLTDVAVTT